MVSNKPHTHHKPWVATINTPHAKSKERKGAKNNG
nr:MAG TPA: hypothetical protein [Caudoviricetes sp.]